MSDLRRSAVRLLRVPTALVAALGLQLAPATVTVLTFSASPVMAQSYPAWAPNTPYSIGSRVTYNGRVYRCIQAHTSLNGWEPSNTPALWADEGPTGTPTIPAVPSGLSASASSTSQINVSWSAVSGATGYDLMRDGAIVSSVTSPHAHTGLAAGSTHTYAVRAKNSAGASAWSSNVSATTNTSASIPAVPSGLAAAATSTTQIRVTWNTVSGATGYDIRRDGVITSNVTSPHLHSGLAAGSSHTYAIRAKNSAGVSAWSSNVTATTNTGTTVPSVPAGLTATVNSSSQITVTWSASSGATGYDIQRDGVIVSNVTSPHVHSGLAAGSTHTYAIRAKNSAGASAWSSTINATTTSGTTLPGIPGGLTATVNSSSQITVTWNSVSNATGYDLLRDGVTVTSVTSPHVHSNLAAGSTHSYAVRAKNSAGSSGWSSSVSATTTSGTPGGNLTLGQVSNPNGRYFTGYYPTWSDNWFTAYNWDGTKKTDNEIYQASQFARIPGIYTHVLISFGQPDFAWNGLAANNWSGTGINFNGTPKDIKESIRLLHILKKKVILAVGGATYNNWAGLANEAGTNGPIKNALTRFMVDMDVDGLDVDYEIIAADAATVTEYAKAIQAMREAVDAAGGGRLLTVAAWSTGADYTADLSGEPGYPGVPSYWGGGAGRERKVFKRVVPNGPHAGKTIVNLFHVVNIMAYDAQTLHFDPVTAFDQYRAITPSSIPVGLGLEIPPEGWAGGVLVINNSQAGADGTIVIEDQYGRRPRGPYSVERSIGHVLANSRNSHDGAMLWQILKTQSVQAGAHPSANATTVEQKLTSMFGYVPTSP